MVDKCIYTFDVSYLVDPHADPHKYCLFTLDMLQSPGLVTSPERKYKLKKVRNEYSY